VIHLKTRRPGRSKEYPGSFHFVPLGLFFVILQNKHACGWRIVISPAAGHVTFDLGQGHEGRKQARLRYLVVHILQMIADNSRIERRSIELAADGSVSINRCSTR
jgi:hypothetical protein